MIYTKTISAVVQAGAAKAKTIATNDIVIDERVQFKCLVPRCPDYGVCPACPPNSPSFHEIQALLNRYKLAVLLQIDSKFIPDSDYYQGANLLQSIVLEGEKVAFLAGARFATGLIGGSCHMCLACRKGDKCPTPDKVRPSMEAMSIDVFATAEKAGMPITFPVKDIITWTGLILLD